MTITAMALLPLRSTQNVNNALDSTMLKECGFCRLNTASFRSSSTKVSMESSFVNNNSQSKKSSRRKLKISRIRNILKLPSILDRRLSKPLTETQLRKKLTKLASKGDWDAVRKLLSDYELPTVAREDSSVPPNPLQEDPTTSTSTSIFTRRRRRSSSYRSGRNRSLSGGESTAAAAVIQAVTLNEEIESNDSANVLRTKQEENANGALFDTFGIDGYTVDMPVISHEDSVVNTPQNQLQSKDQQTAQVYLTDDDIYQQHLLDYLYDFTDDLEGCEYLEYADEDGFDILDDPSEAEYNEASLIIDETTLTYVKESSTHPLFVVTNDDDDCVSVLSDIIVSLNH